MMKTVITTLCVATLSLGTMAATMVPAQAYSQAQQQNWKFQKHGNYAYLNGHQGDMHFHPGWRYYNGYYFPPAAFLIGGLIFGGILGSIIANSHH